jgi:hypothetical protein
MARTTELFWTVEYVKLGTEQNERQSKRLCNAAMLFIRSFVTYGLHLLKNSAAMPGVYMYTMRRFAEDLSPHEIVLLEVPCNYIHLIIF